MALAFPRMGGLASGSWSPFDDFFGGGGPLSSTMGAGPLSSLFNPPTASWGQLSMPAPRQIWVNVAETEGGYEVTADLPGAAKEDVEVTHEGDSLTIRSSTEQTNEGDENQGGVRWHRVERSMSYASRTLRMPQNADLNQINARMDRGVLKISVPKKEKGMTTGPKQISIS